MIRSRTRTLMMACGLWSGLLIYLALQPEAVIMFVLRSKAYFPAAHVAAYALMGFLISLSLRFMRKAGRWQFGPIGAMALSFALCFVLGAMTEILQVYSPDRIPDWADLVCDLQGAALGIMGFYFYQVMRRKSKSLQIKHNAVEKSSPIQWIPGKD